MVGLNHYDGDDYAYPNQFVRLERNPSSPYDSNCIRVVHLDGKMIGHIKATEAKILAHIIDEVCADGSLIQALIHCGARYGRLEINVEIGQRGRKIAEERLI